ncbi:GNAT family N-acetyltransferase [Sandarakinorhabdus oryzae]|uniref:GNAT family N-acetyltransferase n=1 Tax=Sandarakinorhabdus oryzae TaxID=2675220 RepID=UPI0012E193F9|nr:GNAT family N-acetyltransferase [Sandarakinorhabdus oryzae]
MQSLARPVWQALGAGWAGRAVRFGGAVRLDRRFGPLAALDPGADPADLAALAEPGEALWLVEPEPVPPPPGFAVTRQGQLLQMRAGPLGPPPPCDLAMEPLGDADAPAMQALAALTQPGPFASHTNEMGRFIGVKRDGQLLAMAGERMPPAGFGEVSGVCTHPDARGLGLAAALSHAIASRIAARGDVPFLHCWPDNRAAVTLYERLGFSRSGAPWLTVIERQTKL